MKGRLSFDFSVAQHFTEHFKQKDNVLNTSTITAVTKSSMKPRSDATVNRHLCSSAKKNGEQRRTKVSFGASIGAAAVGKKAHLGTKRR